MTTKATEVRSTQLGKTYAHVEGVETHGKITPSTVPADRAPGQDHPNCLKCGEWKTAQTPFMEPKVPVGNIELAVIGERPDGAEDKHGLLSIGRSGRLLRQWAEDSGAEPGQWFIQNAKRCGVEKPTLGQVRLCRPFLLRDLNKHQPRKIVGFGEWASKTIQDTGKTTLRADRNRNLTMPGLDYEPDLITLTY